MDYFYGGIYVLGDLINTLHIADSWEEANHKLNICIYYMYIWVICISQWLLKYNILI